MFGLRTHTRSLAVLSLILSRLLNTTASFPAGGIIKASQIFMHQAPAPAAPYLHLEPEVKSECDTQGMDEGGIFNFDTGELKKKKIRSESAGELR